MRETHGDGVEEDEGRVRDIFEKHMLDELDELSFRVFREVNTESRDAIRRSKRKLLETFEVNICVGDVETVETEKLEGKQMQYHFCSKAADSGNLVDLLFRSQKQLPRVFSLRVRQRLSKRQTPATTTGKQRSVIYH